MREPEDPPDTSWMTFEETGIDWTPTAIAWILGTILAGIAVGVVVGLNA